VAESTRKHYNDAYLYATFICFGAAVRTTLNIDEDLLEKARVLSGVQEKTALVREGLKALIERESARRLARLGGSEPQLEPIPRRRSQTES
jgi:Arc/MetJ family transcription regulator